MWRKKRENKNHPEAKFPFLNDDDGPVKVDEAELENELMDILGEDAHPVAQVNRSGRAERAPRERMQALLEDMGSDGSFSGSIEFDENDPELLSELEAFVKECSPPSQPKCEQNKSQQEPQSNTVSLSEINNRLAAYRSALEDLKKHRPSETAKIRRFSRSVQQLESCASGLSRGKQIDPENIPPPLPASSASSAGSKETNEPSASSAAVVDLTPLKNRLEEYKLAASEAQNSGNNKRAHALNVASQMIAEVIPKIESGLEPFDPKTDLPPPPDEFELEETESAPADSSPAPPRSEQPAAPISKIQDQEKSGVTSSVIALKRRCQEYKIAAIEARDSGNLERAKSLLQAAKVIEEEIPKVESGEDSFCVETDLPPPPAEFENTDADARPAPASQPISELPSFKVAPAAHSQAVTVENIQARLDYYKALLADAQTRPSEGTRQRRLTRIVNQYKEGLKACEHGIKNFNYGELPPPPKCPSLAGPPTVRSETSAGATAGSAHASASSSTTGGRTERIVALLKTRQNELKMLALKAKEEGNLDLARAHLRSALTINPMIESAQAGLTVDFSKLPHLPSSGSAGPQSSGVGLQRSIPVATGPILSGTECDPPTQFVLDMNAAESEEDRCQILIKQMTEQMTEASKLAQSLQTSGWSELAKKASDLATLCKSSLPHCRRQGIPYTFEWAHLPCLNMNADLSDSVLEVSAVRGFAYPLPPKFTHASQMDTYVEILFSYPSSEQAQKFCTPWCKHSVEPLYESGTKFDVDIKSRIYSRFIQGGRDVKATVYYNAGVFKGTRVLGTASFSLKELNQSATITPVADLMESRRAVGGRLMLKFRQRVPLSGPPVVTSRKPWLTIGGLKPTLIRPPVVKPSGQGESHPHSSREQTPIEPPLPPHRPEIERGHSRASIVRTDNTRNYACLSVLRQDRNTFSQQLKNPHLTENERQECVFRLGEAEKRYERLKHRLYTRSDAKSQMETYLNELQVLQSQWHHEYNEAKRCGDQKTAEFLSTRLDALEKELEHHTRSRMRRS
ncbi:hypothetical protein D915_002911 [Fasciola hepatica]|uniref:DM14 domain-containing protein n=1 Tax=Fasciola hepatica TaxID=6192 RepID=A0A4E0RX64_FASHE|nr:hypothetical protein D915_002911 [Fasciola hepatica]